MRTVIFSLFIAIMGIVGLGSAFNAVRQRSGASDITLLTLNSSANSYVLGEPVSLTIEFMNDGSEPVKLGNCFDLSGGDIKLFVSKDGGPFKKYSHSKWGVADGVCRSTVQPQQHLEQGVRLLWNFVPEVTNIDELAKEQLVTNYAFPEKGIYTIKATFRANLSGRLVELTSDPINIIVTEPFGEDLQVWEKIKDRPDLGYFIQEGEFRTYDKEKREKLKVEMEGLVKQHPNSKILGPAEDNLRKFRP